MKTMIDNNEIEYAMCKICGFKGSNLTLTKIIYDVDSELICPYCLIWMREKINDLQATYSGLSFQ